MGKQKEVKVSADNVVSKTRKWFLTINEDAVVYPVVIEVLKSIENLEYSIILHDKDNEEQPHYHCILDYKNARTFEQVKSKFMGAHIEVLASMYMSCRYLLHLDHKTKHQYELSEVITNCNAVEYYINHNEFEKLDAESLFLSIESCEVLNLTTAIKKFGLKQVNLHRNLILNVLEEHNKCNGASAVYDMGVQVGYSQASTEYEETILELNTKIMILERKLKETEQKIKNNLFEL